MENRQVSLNIKLENDYKSLHDYVGFLLNDAERAENDAKMNKAKNKPKAAWKMIKENKGRPPRDHQ
jgi:hypothetical protein